MAPQRNGAVLVEGITDRIALEAVAAKLGRDLAAEGIEVVPIGGAQAIRRAAAGYEGEPVSGLCDANEERWFRRVLGDATYVCVRDLEDELIRALGPDAVQEVVAAQGELETFRSFQNQVYWRGKPVERQLRRCVIRLCSWRRWSRTTSRPRSSASSRMPEVWAAERHVDEERVRSLIRPNSTSSRQTR